MDALHCPCAALQCLTGMPRLTLLVGISGLCVALLCPLTTQAEQQSRTAHHKRARPAATNVAARKPAREPAARLLPEQMPANPPQVTYRDGMLSIEAENARLGDVLTAVGEQTGASMKIPDGLDERIEVHLGPSEPRKVLADLLQGAGFDYVIVGSASAPGQIADVVLTRTSAALPTANNPQLAAAVASEAPQSNAQLAPPLRRRHTRRDAVLALIPAELRPPRASAPSPDAQPIQPIYDRNSAPVPEALLNNGGPLKWQTALQMLQKNHMLPAPRPDTGSNAGPDWSTLDPSIFKIERIPSPSSDDGQTNPTSSNDSIPNVSVPDNPATPGGNN